MSVDVNPVGVDGIFDLLLPAHVFKECDPLSGGGKVCFCHHIGEFLSFLPVQGEHNFFEFDPEIVGILTIDQKVGVGEEQLDDLQSHGCCDEGAGGEEPSAEGFDAFAEVHKFQCCVGHGRGLGLETGGLVGVHGARNHGVVGEFQVTVKGLDVSVSPSEVGAYGAVPPLAGGVVIGEVAVA